MIRRATLLATILVVCACNKDKSPAQAEGSATPPTTNRVEKLSSTDGIGASATETVTAYLKGVVKHDWAAVCDTRIPSEQQEMARLAGSCEMGMSKVFDDAAVSLLANAKPGAVRKQGAIVAVDITDPAMTLYLEAQGSRWLLVDLRKEPGF